jgi:hypothetical protein
VLDLGEGVGQLEPEGLVRRSGCSQRERRDRRLLGPNYGEQKVLGTREAVAKIHRLMERQAGKSVELSVMAMGAHRQPLCPTTKLQKKRSS